MTLTQRHLSTQKCRKSIVDLQIHPFDLSETKQMLDLLKISFVISHSGLLNGQVQVRNTKGFDSIEIHGSKILVDITKSSA